MPRLREMFSAIMYIAYSMKKTQNGENLIVRCVNCSKNILKYRVTDLIQHKQIHMHTERAVYLSTATPFYGSKMQLFGKMKPIITEEIPDLWALTY